MTSDSPNGAVVGIPDWSPAVLNALYEQAFATPDVETAGILVHLGMEYPRSPLVAAVIGVATSAKWLGLLAVAVTFALGFRRRARAQP